MVYTFFDFISQTKGETYLVAFSLMLCFIPFYLFLTQREDDR
jgi:hypothetical protein